MERDDEARREEQYRAIAATSVDVCDEEEVDTVLASLREARRIVATQRHQH